MRLLQNTFVGKTLLAVKRGEIIFDQGDSADAIFFIQSGKVKISVLSTSGQEAVVAMLGSPSFFGEGSLVGQSPAGEYSKRNGAVYRVPDRKSRDGESSS
jgi:CRP-like cAMP-binding protein